MLLHSLWAPMSSGAGDSRKIKGLSRVILSYRGLYLTHWLENLTPKWEGSSHKFLRQLVKVAWLKEEIQADSTGSWTVTRRPSGLRNWSYSALRFSLQKTESPLKLLVDQVGQERVYASSPYANEHHIGPCLPVGPLDVLTLFSPLSEVSPWMLRIGLRRDEK